MLCADEGVLVPLKKWGSYLLWQHGWIWRTVYSWGEAVGEGRILSGELRSDSGRQTTGAGIVGSGGLESRPGAVKHRLYRASEFQRPGSWHRIAPLNICQEGRSHVECSCPKNQTPKQQPGGAKKRLEVTAVFETAAVKVT